MATAPTDPTPAASIKAEQRIGFAKLTKMAFDGVSLLPLLTELTGKLDAGTASPGDGMDLSLITQLLGERDTGLAIQNEILALHRLYRSPCATPTPRLRVLALAASIDMGGNTPIEFLLQDSDIELTTLYVVPGTAMPSPLPEHDVAIVIASDSEECRPALAEIDALAATWPRPLLNPPAKILNLDRDKLYHLLDGIEGLEIPATLAVSRAKLLQVLLSDTELPNVAGGIDFPMIIRPRGSHAGIGLAKIDDVFALGKYLIEQKGEDFFLARYVDYASEDGLFRKYRVVVADGKPYACHMAIADQWNIWYLNAGMSESESKRLEEATFMQIFDIGFGLRHRSTLKELSDRVGLDYFIIDCAETKAGDLLIFEADNTAVVHNMDSPELFPYKPAQMHKIFDAFAALLTQRAKSRAERAA
uniref:ATP-grasp domain-containing protein n=1 Tax=Rhodopseudomonas palustris (strain BisA53) TaxID=316055 RepID=Q07H29_RHOP5